MTVQKKILETIVSIVLICAIIVTYIFLESYLANYVVQGGYNSENIRGLYAEEENSLDMIYIGGSACFVYWEALKAWDDYGYTSYNFAADTLTPQSIKYCIGEAQKTQNPELWVIDLRPFQYGDELYSPDEGPKMYYEVPIRNVTDHLKFSALRKELIDISVPDKSKRPYYYFHFLNYHSNVAAIFTQKAFELFTGKIGVEDFIRLSGYDKMNRRKGFYFVEKTEAVDFTDFKDVTELRPLEGDVQKYFIDLLDFCKEEGITPLFVVHSYCQQEEDKQKYNYMQQVIESYGFDFINTNDYFREIGLDYSFDFYNENHVNIFGADKYTNFLAKYIKEEYNMPDHRGDPAFEDWDACSDEFCILADKTKEKILQYAEESNES